MTNDANFESAENNLLIDLEGIEGQSFEVIPKGDYDCVIEDVKYAFSQSSGKPMWNVTLTITEGTYQNRKLFTFLSFSEKALPGTKTQINRIAPELISKHFDPKKIAEEGTLTGRAVRAKVVIEQYEGEDKNRVKNLYAPKGGNDGFIG